MNQLMEMAMNQFQETNQSINSESSNWDYQRSKLREFRARMHLIMQANPIHSRYDEILEKEKARVANLKELAIKGNLEGLKHALSN